MGSHGKGIQSCSKQSPGKFPLGREQEEYQDRWRSPLLGTRPCDGSFGSHQGAGERASSQDVVHNMCTLFVTARPANSECSLKTNQPARCLPHAPTKIFCRWKTVKNYDEVQAKIEMSSFSSISVGLLLQTGAKSPKKIPSSGKETAMTLSPHTKKSSAQKEVLFLVVFQMKTVLSPKRQCPLFRLTFLNTIYWQMFLCGIEVSFIPEISSFYSPRHISLKINQSAFT